MRGKIKIVKFEYFLGIDILQILLLRHCDNLSKTLESPKTASEGPETFQSYRNQSQTKVPFPYPLKTSENRWSHKSLMLQY